jgi:hypothetical protein
MKIMTRAEADWATLTRVLFHLSRPWNKTRIMKKVDNFEKNHAHARVEKKNASPLPALIDDKLRTPTPTINCERSE